MSNQQEAIGNDMWQADVKIPKKVIKANNHRSRNTELQLVNGAVFPTSSHNYGGGDSTVGGVEVVQIQHTASQLVKNKPVTR
jgi:hypothetical protein